MESHSVLLCVSSPERALLEEALAPIGVRVRCADRDETLLEMLGGEAPLVVVAAGGEGRGSLRQLTERLRAASAEQPLFLLADEHEDVLARDIAAQRLGPTRLFPRPLQVAALADAVERLAVIAELDEEEGSGAPSESGSSQQAVPQAPSSPSSAEGPEDDTSPDGGESQWSSPRPVPTVVTAALAAGGSARAQPGVEGASLQAPAEEARRQDANERVPSGTGPLAAARRADEAGALEVRPIVVRVAASERSTDEGGVREGADSGTPVPSTAGTPPAGTPVRAARAGGARKLPARSTMARFLDAQLEEAEQRLFPAADELDRGVASDEPVAPVDLDSLGVQTIPGLPLDALDEGRSAGRSPTSAAGPSRQTSGGRLPATGNDAQRAAAGAQAERLASSSDSSPGRGRDPASERRAHVEAGPRERRQAPRPRGRDGELLGADGLAAWTAPASRPDAAPRAASTPALQDSSPAALGQVEALRRSRDTRVLPALASVDERSLESTDLCQLLCSLHASGFGGRLRVVRGDGEKCVWFDGGAPVGATSTFAFDGLPELLLRDGLIDRRQYAEATAAIADRGGRAAVEELVRLGFVKQSEAFALLRRQTEAILYSLFGWSIGVVLLEPGELAPSERLRCSAHPWALFLEGVRRKVGLERLLELTGGPTAVYGPSLLFEQVVASAGLSAEERRLVELVDGRATLAELWRQACRAGVRLDESAVYAVAWMLAAAGGLRPQSSPAAAQLSQPSTQPVLESPPPTERRQAARHLPELASEVRIDRARIDAKRAQLDDIDYFAMLGLDPSATTLEVERAYAQLSASFASERLPAELRDGARDALTLIQRELAEARRLLVDDVLRVAYRAALFEGRTGGPG